MRYIQHGDHETKSTMWTKTSLHLLCPSFLLFLFLSPGNSFHMGNQAPQGRHLFHKGHNWGDLLTASIIGLAIGGVRNRLKQQQKPLNLQQQMKVSANNQHARFLPFPLQGLMPFQPQFPMMHQASQMLPAFHPQILSRHPFMEDPLAPLLMMEAEEAMASQLMHSILLQQQPLLSSNPLLSGNPLLSSNPLLSNNPFEKLPGLSSSPFEKLQGMSSSPFEKLQGMSSNPFEKLQGMSSNPFEKPPGLSSNPFENMQGLSSNPFEKLQGLSSSPMESEFPAFPEFDEVEKQWKALESQAIRTILAYGAQ
ncbi:hypothetical protein JTE90_010547 [Oedothorax gibbosus]|uniref:Uncharacterized protein n=1 Tax=Oedothorax gibbosus TaxID=931172 RepID=A0AAV6U4I4_9ARAC|nr:hypothetical protein JTE90_010547 [Oedothorax gibbosus]